MIHNDSNTSPNMPRFAVQNKPDASSSVLVSNNHTSFYPKMTSRTETISPSFSLPSLKNDLIGTNVPSFPSVSSFQTQVLSMNHPSSNDDFPIGEKEEIRVKRPGRRKIDIEYIKDKNRRHITFSKRKSGIMKKAFELSTLTGTQLLLLVASETGHIYTFATPKLQPIISKTEGKKLIQNCLSNNSSELENQTIQNFPEPLAQFGKFPQFIPPQQTQFQTNLPQFNNNMGSLLQDKQVFQQFPQILPMQTENVLTQQTPYV